MISKKLLCLVWIIVIIVTILISINFKLDQIFNYFTYWMLGLTVMIAFLYIINANIQVTFTSTVWMLTIFVLIGAIIIILYNAINNNDNTVRSRFTGKNGERVPIFVMTQIVHHVLPPFFLFLVFGWPKAYPNLLHIILLIITYISVVVLLSGKMSPEFYNMPNSSDSYLLVLFVFIFALCITNLIVDRSIKNNLNF